MKNPVLHIVLFLFSIQSFGQILIGKTIYTFRKPYSIDTIAKGKNRRYTIQTDTISDIAEKAHNFQKASINQIHYCDSIITLRFSKAIVLQDSMEFIRNHVRILGATNKPEDFLTYKLQRTDFYRRLERRESKKLKRSDRYYSSFFIDDKAWYVVLFDPHKLKTRLMGDIIWFVYLNPLIIDPATSTLCFNGTLDLK